MNVQLPYLCVWDTIIVFFVNHNVNDNDNQLSGVNFILILLFNPIQVNNVHYTFFEKDTWLGPTQLRFIAFDIVYL